jgi:hypothetical protein
MNAKPEGFGLFKSKVPENNQPLNNLTLFLDNCFPIK